MVFQKLVRFEQDGSQYYGNLIKSAPGSYEVERLSGNLEQGFQLTDLVVKVSKLLCPLEFPPIILCVGLNYQKHVTEANLTVPKYPVIFTKPSDALIGPFDDVRVHKDCQSHLDYEGELCVVIGRDAKNVSVDHALEYVLGYTSGNDISARNFQLPEASGGQFCYAKSFDGFAPIGPSICSPDIIPDPQSLCLKTIVNGQTVQETSTGDMIWSVRELIAHLSRGTTIRRGTVIMTGTPSGVGYFRNSFLKDGDTVEVEIDGMSKVMNKVVFLS